MNKIMVVGRAGSGKDTVCEYLRNEIGAKQFALADKLKEMCEIHNGDADRYYMNLQVFIERNLNKILSPKDREWLLQGTYDIFKRSEKVNGKNRELLQRVGEFARTVYGNIWIDVCNESINTFLSSNNSPVTISDIRYINEFNYFKAKGFFGIKVVRDYNKRIESLTQRDGMVDESRLNHSSEVEVDLINDVYTIYNNGTIEQLYNNIDTLL